MEFEPGRRNGKITFLLAWNAVSVGPVEGEKNEREKKKRNGTSLAFPLGRLALLRAHTHTQTHRDTHQMLSPPQPPPRRSLTRSVRTHAAPSIFISTVGANLLCGEWNIGIGERRSQPRQTVILRQTPAHPGPSLHLSDLEPLHPSLRSRPAPRLLSWRKKGKKDDASPQPHYHIKDFPLKSMYAALRLTGGSGWVSLPSVCSESREKLRPWKAKHCISENQSTAELHWL